MKRTTTTTRKASTKRDEDASLLKQSIKDVDDLFTSLKETKKKEKKQRRRRDEAAAAADLPTSEKKRPRHLDPVEEAFMKKTADANNNPKVHRWDEESGLPVYKFWELGIGEGKGDTEDCPFDCSCCR